MVPPHAAFGTFSRPSSVLSVFRALLGLHVCGSDYPNSLTARMNWLATPSSRAVTLTEHA